MEPIPGTRHPRRRHHLDWELIACGVAGHLLVAGDSTPDGVPRAVVQRMIDGVPWHRCLRCDAWVVLDPTSAAVAPAPAERELPLRGKALHDRIILRLIAIDRVLHFLVLTTIGIAVLAFAHDRTHLRRPFYRVATALQSAIGGGPVSTSGHVGIVHDLDRLFDLSKGHLIAIGIAVLAYGLMEGVEAIGLWWGRRWAEYLTFVATTVLLPFEVYELTESVTPLKVIGFLINLAVVVYLVYAKRLFGLRGGGTVDDRERARDSGWTAIQRATPPTVDRDLPAETAPT